MSSWSFLFSGLKNPNFLSLSSWQSCSIPLITLVASSGLAPAGPCPSCAGTPELDAALQVGSQQSGAEGQNPLPALLPTGLWMQPSTRGFLGSQSTRPGHAQPLTHQHPQILLPGLLWICSSPAWIGTRGCSDPGAAPWTWSVKPHEILMGHCLSLFMSLWITPSITCHAHHSAWCHLQNP